MPALQMLASATLVGLLSLILLGMLAAIVYVGLMIALAVSGMVATVVFVVLVLVALTGGFAERPAALPPWPARQIASPSR